MTPNNPENPPATGIDALEQRIAELERENEQLKATMSVGWGQLLQSRDENKELRATIETLTRERDLISRQNVILADANNSIRAQLAASEKDRKALETAAQGLRDALGTMQAIQARMTGDGPPLDMYYVSAANAKTKEALARFDALKEGK